MITRFLDTDILSLLQRGDPDVATAFGGFPPGSIAVTVITVEEQLTGWYTLIRRVHGHDQLALAYRSLAENVVSLTGFPILSFEEPAIVRSEAQVALRLGVRKPDLRIAAITLEQGAILVTRNVRDFRRVPGLTVENWVL
jgi:tRNA(fMet)-specific endonuclease VapC